jgi:hypothetical protein
VAMTHEELLAKIDGFTCCSGAHELALRAVVELHKQRGDLCETCFHRYPCATIQAIEKELG